MSQFAITVTDSSTPALSATVHAALTVRLDIQPSKLPAGTLNIPYGPSGHGVQLTAEGGSGNYAYTAAGLPPGLEITDGLITGTPSEEGTYTTAIEIHDATNHELDATRNYTVKVNPKAKK
jgi:hypothetical protein